MQKLTNLPVNAELIYIINPMKKWGQDFINKVKGPEGITAFFIGFSLLYITHIFLEIFVRFFATWITISSWILLIMVGLIGGLCTQALMYVIWRQRTKIYQANITHSLEILLSEVERYNSVIKAIDINDQIEAVGNNSVGIKERNSVIEALKLTRYDLIRALKTERILRENRKFIISNTDLFANNLATLASMQVTEQATEHGRLLNEALQIALEVQYEMKKLQNQY
nr:hypothetical protein [Iningainema tapete]